ncbi:MAG: calcium/sodium antiporter [Ruminococcaceae bacterium]|nr:calcium/sodium antiporter [Oscillospiraceae bacterium]
MELFLNILFLAIGMVLLVKGADFFVDGSSKIAKAIKIPSLIIGLTLVSMGTSAPEASVSINSAISGMNDMSLGNVVGSDIFNTLLILGISALIVPLAISRDMKKYDIPIMVGLYIVLMVLGFVITPYKLDRIESIIMLVLFVAYMFFLVLRAKKSGAQEEIKEEKKSPLWKNIIFAVLGLAGIIWGGDIVVDNASELAIALGMSEALVGLTIVAVGTSLPELVTSIIASLKKEDDIAIGNVIGSNIFNIIFILGFSSTIKPLTLTNDALFDLIVMLISGVLVLAVSLTSKNMKRWHGIIFMLGYVAYLGYIIYRNYAA